MTRQAIFGHHIEFVRYCAGSTTKNTAPAKERGRTKEFPRGGRTG